MGATRRRRSSRQSSSQDSPSDCFGSFRVSQDPPLTIPQAAGINPHPAAKVLPTKSVAIVGPDPVINAILPTEVPSKQQFRHTLGNLDHENQEAINTAPGTLALGPAYLLVINPPPDSLALGPADLLVINPLQHILDLEPPALALTVPLPHALGAALPYAPLPGSLTPGLGDRLPSDNAAYSYGEIQKVGARWQRWLEDENFSGCKVNLRRRPLDLMTLINHPTPSRRWVATRNYFCDPPAIYIQDLSSLGLPTRSDQYRKFEIQGPPVPEDDEPNEYTHCTGPGVIFAQDIARYDGPHWNDIALGQYAMDFSIDSLRHIYFCDVINQNTREFVVGVLYRNILPVPWRDWSPDEDVQRFWEYGTPEYQGILGTTFGKGVCALLISAFPRGDFMIGRVVTWKDGDLQMRFDIESTEHLNPRRGGGLF
ncbi:hypothetical protein MYU51_016683 [Penicillium brevicompactum]